MSIYIFSGNKGGVGKSMAAIAFTEYLLAAGLDPLVVETDTQNPDVGRKYGDRAQFINVTDSIQGWGKVADLADQHRDRPMVLNLPAGIGEAWKKGAPLMFEALAESGVEISAHVFFVINRQKDSIVLLKDAMERDPSGGAIKSWFVVKNLYFGDAEKFALWNDSKTRRELLESGKGHEVEMPELADWVADKLTGRPTTVAASADDTDTFTLSERTAIKRWLRTSGEEFSRVSAYWKA